MYVNSMESSKQLKLALTIAFSMPTKSVVMIELK